MRRAEAIASVLSKIGDALVVAANGWISRETCAASDRVENFYMLGSMGLAAPIGLGLAVAQPERRVVIFDGDGNLLMTLGALAMIGDLRPPNFLHIVFDNEVYGSTGGQRSATATIALDALARAAGYVAVRRTVTAEELDDAIDALLPATGPAFLLVKVDAAANGTAPRVPHEPEAIAARMRSAIAREAVAIG
ncbi:MAG: sulfopyruvate decarboxylase subunit beta [Thermoanaerobaculia bacterium]|jgi:thiamine pyrophosphate-dependent acetolactate synthase large subunit-like protein|nr:sulfopyruvate decarboxylase subunit beta [Thermoanaerobaculia bacterium]